MIITAAVVEVIVSTSSVVVNVVEAMVKVMAIALVHIIQSNKKKNTIQKAI
jgi:hypothetical protein